MGTTQSYQNLIAGGVWRGQWGNRAQAETYLANGDGGYADGLHGDGHAIWPGGFNYDSEDGFLRRLWHTRVMAGIRADMGILSFTREAQNEFALLGEEARFAVESPVGTTFQWFKDGSPLQNGLRITGANTAVLRIFEARASDAGNYFCEATGGAETFLFRQKKAPPGSGAGGAGKGKFPPGIRAGGLRSGG
ncbi:immunoglobulin domain-containing protein [Roseibacillus ishigakijimensis]|uniref:Immunoglobulin domain-containing protein n=1 Tax=Roseibacillus ishigakijimensis TaxID=454146 RepID=A0A934RPV0_9BACT|nr:immunoglobulin domain-containing protein [Roseibacillus ishigakijimensis]MBK1834775.1 immunoglobulin domain-containing protein [Roseibacillus ishigakijimensis]